MTKMVKFLLITAYIPVRLYLQCCRATIKSEVKLEKTLTFVLIATKTSWLFTQLKTVKKLNKLNCLEQCN